MITNEGKRYMRSRILDKSNPIANPPAMTTLGTGSGTVDGTRNKLFNEASGIRAYATMTSGTANQIQWTQDYSTDQMSGLSVREIGVLGSIAATNWYSGTTYFDDNDFNVAVASGTNWYTTGPAPWSGLVVTTWNYNPTGSAAGSSFKMEYYPGSPLNAVTSGQSYQIMQPINISGGTIGKISFGYWMAQGGSNFIGEVLFNGSMIGSLYYATNTSGNYNISPLYDYSGTGEFIVRMAARYAGQPSGATYLYVDNFRNDLFTSGQLYSYENFSPVSFNGTQECQLTITWKIY